MQISNRLKKLQSKNVDFILCPWQKDKIDLLFLIKELGKQDIDSIMIEAGGSTNFECIKQNIVNEIKIFVSPTNYWRTKCINCFRRLGI